MYSSQTIAALITGIMLSFAIPIAAVIIYKLKNREVWLPSAFIGAAAFFVFALILEQISHAIMFSLVKSDAAFYNVFYIIYGALAAGVFEETGRFVAYKTLMRKKYSVKNAVMMGLGHGGFEAMMVLGCSMFGLTLSAIMVNSQGLEAVLAAVEAGAPQAADATRTQLEALTSYGFGNMAISVFERLLAMTGHVCFSVVVFFAAARPKKVYLFPAAILLHALFDVPAAMSQVGIITSVPLLYTVYTVFTVCLVVFTVILAKKLPGRAE